MHEILILQVYAQIIFILEEIQAGYLLFIYICVWDWISYLTLFILDDSSTYSSEMFFSEFFADLKNFLDSHRSKEIFQLVR